MASSPHALESVVARQICSFLDARSLCSVEAAGLDRSSARACWGSLLSALEEQLAGKRLSKPGSKPMLTANPKWALRELQLWLRNLVRVPEPWAIFVRKISDTEIKICPRRTWAGYAFADVTQHNGLEDSLSFTAMPPKLAHVPLSTKCVRGKPMFVGVLLTALKLRKIGEEACMLGIELTGIDESHRQWSYFCPISGKVFVRFPGQQEGMVAQAMPALDAASIHDDPQDVQAFVLVDDSGCISFGRRWILRDSIEWSGEIRSCCQPPQTAEYCASLTFQVDKLEVPAQISITQVGDLPLASEEHNRSTHEFNSAWSVHEWPCASNRPGEC